MANRFSSRPNLFFVVMLTLAFCEQGGAAAVPALDAKRRGISEFASGNSTAFSVLTFNDTTTCDAHQLSKATVVAVPLNGTGASRCVAVRTAVGTPASLIGWSCSSNGAATPEWRADISVYGTPGCMGDPTNVSLVNNVCFLAEGVILDVGVGCNVSSTPSSTPTSSPTSTPSSSRTGTPSSSRTHTPSSSRTHTPSSSHTRTPSSSRTGTPSHSRTGTPSSSHTGTPSHSRTGTPSSSHTPSPSTPASIGLAGECVRKESDRPSHFAAISCLQPLDACPALACLCSVQ